MYLFYFMQVYSRKCYWSKILFGQFLFCNNFKHNLYVCYFKDVMYIFFLPYNAVVSDTFTKPFLYVNTWNFQTLRLRWKKNLTSLLFSCWCDTFWIVIDCSRMTFFFLALCSYNQFKMSFSIPFLKIACGYWEMGNSTQFLCIWIIINANCLYIPMKMTS